MIYDALNQVSNAQAVTASAVSTDSMDLLQTRDIGEGTPLFMMFTVTAAATAAGAATVSFQVVTSAAGALTSPTVIADSGPIAKASLTVGQQIYVPVPPQIGSLGQRYLGAQYTVATGPLTAGAFSAALVRHVSDSKKFYPKNYTLS